MNTKRHAALLFLPAVLWGGLASAGDEPKAAGDRGAIEERAPGQSHEALSGEEAATGVLTLADDLEGEIFIYDTERRLVTKLIKEEGRVVDVRLEPGSYEVEWRPEPEHLTATLSVACGERLVVDRRAFQEEPRAAESPILNPVPRHKSRYRHERSLVPRSWRVTFDTGVWFAEGAGSSTFVVTDHGFRSENGGFLGGVSVGYRASPEWMINVAVQSRVMEVADDHYGLLGDADHVSMISTLSMGARYYVPPLASRSAVKPYVSAGLGPSIGFDIESRDDGWRDHHHDSVRSETVFGGQVGAGVDIQASSWVVLGSDVTYHFVSKFSEPFGGRKDASGFTFSFQIGATFGRRTRPSR